MIDYTMEIGGRVSIVSCEGFGGPATIIGEREVDGGRFRVRMDDGNPPDFWAHDFEVFPPDPEAVKTEDPSIVATREHIHEVRVRISRVIEDLWRRRREHDRSKLLSPEAEVFAEWTEKLKGMTYGSDEYKAALAAMKPALDHHYAANSHHPEHYPDGIRGMSLLDVIEMLIDWKAATLRHADGDIRKSIEINQKRFGYSDELKGILLNTLPLIEGP